MHWMLKLVKKKTIKKQKSKLSINNNNNNNINNLNVSFLVLLTHQVKNINSNF